MSDLPWLIVGLGNPGPTYAGTRHNIGAMAIDELARRHNAKLSTHKRAAAHVAEERLSGQRAVLAVSRGYMNESGGPVKALMSFYKTPPDQLIVLHDELDLPLGAVRLKLGGGDNGHNGLRSIRSSIGTGDFFRVRMGIGRPPGRQDPADFVLKPFAGAERAELSLELDRAADAVEAIILDGLEKAQNVIHTS